MQSAEPSGFESETRVPAPWVGVGLIILGLCIIMLANANPQAGTVMELVTLFLGLGVIGITLLAWRLDDAGMTVGRWLMIGQLIAIIWWADRFWQVPGLLTLLAVPTALAAPLIGPMAAIMTAIVNTMLLLALQASSFAGEPGIMAVSLTSIWSMLCVMVATYQPIREVAEQSWQYYTQARDWLDDARNRKVELEQTLADLADANRQLTRLNILAQELRQAAEEARAAKAQFVANVSHELRTPLNMIIGFSDLILQAPKTYGRRIPPALLADLVVIKRNAEHLADLVDDVLDLSQVETEQVALAKEYTSVHEIINKAATAVRPLFDSKKLYLELDVPSDLPPLFCDATRIREVVLNLLSNAGRFTEHGGVKVRAWRDGNDVTVAISDTGPGIAPEDMTKLFQPFQQLDSSIRRRYGGTGLGLNISKRFIELHDGRIWAESAVGVGTTFFFSLPISPSKMDDAGFARWLNAEWGYRQRTRPSRAPHPKVLPRLMVLDPADALVRLLERYIHDVEIVRVASVQEAIEESQREPAQMLLINGHTVSKSLETLYATGGLPERLPVVVCSVPGISDASAALGASDYLVKPVSRETLLRSLERMNIYQGTILIVDDEPDASQLFRRMLVSSGRQYRVLLARDGQEALALSREYPPDVILLDLVMPNMDGFQLLRVRGEDPRLSSVPFIIISARDPAGQPIVSDALAVTRQGGLSARQLLSMIRFLGGQQLQTDQRGDQELAEDPLG